MVSWLICNVVLKTIKPNRKPNPKELKTYGGPIRQRGLDLDLKQSEVAKIINVTTDTITNWELNRNEPTLTQIPKIILFLGYTPQFNKSALKNYRIQKEINQKELAKSLGIDPTTLSRIKTGRINIISKLKMKLDYSFLKLVKFNEYKICSIYDLKILIRNKIF